MLGLLHRVCYGFAPEPSAAILPAAASASAPFPPGYRKPGMGDSWPNLVLLEATPKRYADFALAGNNIEFAT